MSRALPPLLLLVHCFLFAWAAVGLAEWLVPAAPWPRVSNPLFPRWLLLLHWLAVLAGSVTFLAGYATRWKGTPVAVAVAYLSMAAVCVLETVWFLTSPFRFVAMAAEFGAYAAIVALLRNANDFRQRFGVGRARYAHGLKASV
jgi:hypothetical protein